MQIFGYQIGEERDDRNVVLIKYEGIPLLDQIQSVLNQDEHRCVVIKKNNTTFVLYIFTLGPVVELYLTYDDERYWFEVNKCRMLSSMVETNFELDKVNSIDRSIALVVKSKEWKYRNRNSVAPTENLYEEVNALDNYDVKIEELKRLEEIRLRKEQEDKDAAMQLDIWTKYVKIQRKLLEEANKPFAISENFIEVKKSHVDLETLPFVSTFADSSVLEDISEVLGGKVINNKLEMTLTDFKNWQDNDSLDLDAEIVGVITLKLNVKCDDWRYAKKFKEENGYGYNEYHYGKYDYNTGAIELKYWSDNIQKIYRFFDKVNNSFHFNGHVSPKDAWVAISIKVTITESEDDRKKRIDILSRKKLFSKPNMEGGYLGKLSNKGSDKKNLRINFPNEDKELKKKAKDFFLEKHTKSFLIYPGLLQDKVLLDRQVDALKKTDTDTGLYNPHLKEFILNSSRASATENFIGLTNVQLSSTPEYTDCHNSQMLSLNDSQQTAVVKGLYAKDLCLLQGPPGTGKTTVISELIWQHIRKNQGVRIMLTSQTNLAIENALNRLFSNSAILEGTASWRNMMLIKPLRKADSEKIKEEGLPFSQDRIYAWCKNEELEKNSNNVVSRWMNHISQRVKLEEQYEDILEGWREALNEPTALMKKTFASQYLKDSNVLCMTCGKVGSSDFNTYEAHKGFDVVIVDEASKATLPELLMPLCYAKKSIIIGDHRQLPPVLFENDFFKKVSEIDSELVNNLDNQFRHELVEESLFKRLITNDFVSSTIKATFNVQYRMHHDINDIISQFYAEDTENGIGLECGLDRSEVDIPDFSEKGSRYHGLSLGSFVQPNVHTIWVDVPDGMEQKVEGNSWLNEKEIEAVNLVIETLSRSSGFDQYMHYWRNCKNPETRITESRLGIISFYAAQVQRLKQSTQSYCDRNNIKTTTRSVDEFQGQESGIVIVSTVRTRTLGFTKSPERLNVALSRARRLLIIVGNSEFYSSDRAKTANGQYIYRDIINKIKDKSNSDVFIDYRDLKRLLGYSL